MLCQDKNRRVERGEDDNCGGGGTEELSSGPATVLHDMHNNEAHRALCCPKAQPIWPTHSPLWGVYGTRKGLLLTLGKHAQRGLL